MLIGPVLSQSYDLDLTCRLEDMILASKKKKKNQNDSRCQLLARLKNTCPAAALLQG